MNIRTLYDLSDLRETRFGQPRPRHGLNLLWWFAHDCVQIDNGCMTAKCNLANGDYGFDRFHNREGLLPYTDLEYYKVGNLSSTSLPKYITKNYTRQSENSNTDRLIVSFDSMLNKFEKIYVTQHSDQTNFDQNHTYHISIGLLKNIKKLGRKDFLREAMNRSHISIGIDKSVRSNSCQSISNEPIMGNQDLNHEELLREPMDHSRVTHQSVQDSQTDSCQSKKCCWALICCGLLILLLIIAAIVYSLSK